MKQNYTVMTYDTCAAMAVTFSTSTSESGLISSPTRQSRQVVTLLNKCIYFNNNILHLLLTHRGRVTHICAGNLAIIGSDNGLSLGRRQAITRNNVGILLIVPLGTNFNEMLIEIHTFSFKNIHSKMLSGEWRPFCLDLNVLKRYVITHPWPGFNGGLTQLLLKLWHWWLLMS